MAVQAFMVVQVIMAVYVIMVQVSMFIRVSMFITESVWSFRCTQPPYLNIQGRDNGRHFLLYILSGLTTANRNSPIIPITVGQRYVSNPFDMILDFFKSAALHAFIKSL